MEQLSAKIHNKKNRKIKVLQFGEGNFLRAFIDYFFQEMNDKQIYDGGVAIVQPMPTGRVGDLACQDYLYTLYQEGIENGRCIKKHQIIDIIQDGVDPYTDYSKFLNFATNPDLELIISNTTEAGIVLDPTDLDLSITPKSFPGKLLSFLWHRYKYFNGDSNKGLMIMPCELIDYNGKFLKETLIELARLIKLEDDFIDWIKNSNKFFNTLVDRIVPGFPKDEIEQIQQQLGYLDNFVVKSEIFHLFIIESSKDLGDLLPFNQANLNVLFVPDFRPYKERKVKILNGSHTAIVPIGYLMGIDTVKESIENVNINRFLNEFIKDEVIPTIRLPKEEMERFANSIIERFLNPFIKHYLMSIALNSTTKFTTRILPSLLEYYESYQELPKKCLFSLAALFVFERGMRDQEVINIQDNPEYLQMWKNAWSKPNIKSTVELVLSNETLFGLNLNSIPKFTNTIISYIESIINLGMEQALIKVLD